jgi:hypothetical protein
MIKVVKITASMHLSRLRTALTISWETQPAKEMHHGRTPWCSEKEAPSVSIKPQEDPDLAVMVLSP